MSNLFPTPVEKRELREDQFDAMARLRESFRTGHKRPMFQAPTGFGKCLGRGTPVMLWDGRVYPVEQIKVGDRLMGPDGEPRTVLSTCSGVDPLYRVAPTKGDPYVVNEAHILSLVMTGGTQADVPNPGRDGGLTDGKIINLSVAEYLNRSATFKHCAKGYRAAVDFKYRGLRFPPIHPYFLGLWLGDGRSNGPEICTGDPEIVAWLNEFAIWCDLGITEKPNSENSKCYYLGTPRGQPNPLKLTMKRLELIDNKHIPHSYKTGSRQDRLDLLAGILDTDGYYQPRGAYDLTLKDERLIDDVIFIARSLGFSAYKKQVQKTCHNNGATGTYWQCSICGDIDRIPCKLPRKKAAPRQHKKNPLRVGITVEPIGEGEYFGFEIDGDRLFLLGDFTVTHNTVVGSSIVQGARDKGKRVCFLVPRIDLIDQTVESFARDGITEVGVIQANHHLTDWRQPVQIASVQTLIKRGYPNVDLVVVDEAHMAFDKVHEWMAHPEWQRVPFVGLSATPWTKGLGRHYDDLIIAATTQEMIEAGNLSPFKVFAPTHPDLEGVKTRMGDYVEGDLSKAMNKAPLIADIVQTWLELGERRPTLCFAVDRAHAASLQRDFLAAGVNCGYQDANTKPDERAQIRRDFHRGYLEVVCNVGTLTTGVDWDVRCIILARPTKSEILYTQIIGRGLRTAPGKSECLILDHSDTTLKLGFVTDIHHDELDDGKERANSESVPEEKKPRECRKCKALMPPRVTVCPNCGFKPEVQPKPVDTAMGSLAELQDDVARRAGGTKRVTRTHVEFGSTMKPKADFYAELRTYARQKGYKDGWVANKYKDATGTWPRGHSGAPERPVSFEVASWIQAGNIRWAKRRQREREGVWT